MTAEILEKNVELSCSLCCHREEYSFAGRCSRCGGLLDPVYDQQGVIRANETDPLRRYFDFLPIPRIPVEINWQIGNSPCHYSRRLGALKGIEYLYIKDETTHPTGTTKDRMAQMVVAQMVLLGVREFVGSSTGNSASALAYATQRLGNFHMHSFTGMEFVDRHEYHDDPGVTLHIIDGNYVEASNAAKRFAAEQGLIFEGGFFNYARREGLKTAYFEAYDAIPDGPDVVVQAVASGMGLYGGYRGMREYQRLGRLHKTPRFVCVQQDTCAPMVSAFKDGSAVIREQDIVPNPDGLALAIMRGDPTQTYPYMLRLVRETDGCFAEVSRNQILEAWKLLEEYHGLRADYAGAAALAGAVRLREEGWIKPSDRVLVNLTGGMREPRQSV
jgi:threonine synthase